jgi:type IV pilus assembly protein PilB
MIRYDNKNKGVYFMSQTSDGYEHEGLLSMDEAIETLRTTRPTFYRWLRSGRIKGHKVGRQWRFYPADIERFLQGESPRIDLPVGIGSLLAELRLLLQEQLDEDVVLPVFAETAEGLWHALLAGVIMLGAESFHVESLYASPGQQEGVLRCRVDGVLQLVSTFDRRLLSPLLEAARLSAHCDPHTNESVQKGQFYFDTPFHALKKHEVRMQFLNSPAGPSLSGQLVSAHTQGALSLADITLPLSIEKQLTTILAQGWGLIVASGPTGSGKSSTLNAAMNHIARPALKSFYVQERGEVQLPWVSPVRLAPEESPAQLLKALMESDLDALLLSDVGDRETLQQSLRIALSGHLVMAPLHASDAVSALLLLRDLSDNAYSVSEALHLLLNHRLVRRLCSHCRVQKPLPQDLKSRLESLFSDDQKHLPEGKVWQATGCSHCHNGYRGRLQLTEALTLTPALRRGLFENLGLSEMRALWLSEGGQSWMIDGFYRAKQGLTTLEEILRVAA